MKNEQYTAQNFLSLSLKKKKKKKEVEITTSNIVNSAVNALNSIYTRAGNLVAK